MKKTLVILVLLAYGLSSTGMTLHFHYCCGKLDAITLSSYTKKVCPTQSVSGKGCCDNKHIELKLKQDQEPGAKEAGTHKVLPSLPGYSSVFYPVYVKADRPVNEFSTGPPVAASSLPLFMRNRTFRI
jgi:hypothetical protein